MAGRSTAKPAPSATVSGGEGKGGLGNPLRGRALPLVYIKEVIKRGKNKMPALPHVKDEALDNVARYVNRLP